MMLLVAAFLIAVAPRATYSRYTLPLPRCDSSCRADKREQAALGHLSRYNGREPRGYTPHGLTRLSPPPLLSPALPLSPLSTPPLLSPPPADTTGTVAASAVVWRLPTLGVSIYATLLQIAYWCSSKGLTLSGWWTCSNTTAWVPLAFVPPLVLPHAGRGRDKSDVTTDMHTG